MNRNEKTAAILVLIKNEKQETWMTVIINLLIFSIMKRKIYTGIIVLAIVVIATVNVGLNTQSKDNMSDMSLANVEALADETNSARACYKTITTDYTNYLGERYCGTCTLLFNSRGVENSAGHCVGIY